MRMRSWIFVAGLFLISHLAQAQCAMCNAIVESDAQAGGSAGAGLNEGILYLMAIPYLLLGAVGFALYKHKRNSAA